MSVFTPPAAAVVPPIDVPDEQGMNRLFKYFASGQRGANVYLMSDGTYWQDPMVPVPEGVTAVSAVPAYWNTSETEEPFVRVVNWDQSTEVTSYEPTVVRCYFGGVPNPLSAAEVSALTAAGYGGYID